MSDTSGTTLVCYIWENLDEFNEAKIFQLFHLRFIVFSQEEPAENQYFSTASEHHSLTSISPEQLAKCIRFSPS